MTKTTNTLYIHIGSHKTGTTALQHSLFKQRQQLIDNGITFFCQQPDKMPDKGNSNAWISIEQAPSFNASIKAKLTDELKKLSGTVLVSSEFFSWVFTQESVAKFYHALSTHFTCIKVIVYLRRQDQQAISHHQEGSKSNTAPAHWFYGHSPTALPAQGKHLQHYLNYYGRLSMWADVFGDNNMIIKLYEKEHLKEADITCDFLHLLGLKNHLSSDKANISNGFETTKVGHLMNQAELPLPHRKKIFATLNNSGKLLPSKQQAQSFYQLFKDSNAKLNQRFQINNNQYLFNDDFNNYPEHTSDQWSEQSASQAIINILNGVKNIPMIDNNEVSTILEAAALLQRTNPEKSLELFNIALKLKSDAFTKTLV